MLRKQEDSVITAKQRKQLKRLRDRELKKRERILKAFIDKGHGLVVLYGTTQCGDCECGNPHCSSKGKHPNPRYSPNGLKSPITSWTEAKELIRKLPNANLAVATNKLLVIDVDPGRAGFDSVEALYADHDDAPETVFVRTGSGGVHVYYIAPDGIEIKSSVNTLGPGIDIRAIGGMVVIPPSLHASGERYTFDEDCAPWETEFAPAPDWLVAKLQQPSKPTASVTGVGADTIPEGSRNNTFTRIAGVLRHQGVGAKGILNALRALNPLCSSPLGDYEVTTIANSVAGYETDKPGERGLPPQEPFPVDVFPDALQNFLTKAAEAMGCPMSLLAPHVLSVAAGAIGNSRCIELKEGWTEPAVIWLMVVAESGSLKSPALELIVKPAEIQQQLAMDAHAKAMEAWRALSTEERQTEVKPRAARYLINDATIEAIATILSYTPRGVLLYNDEGAGWIESINAYGSGPKGDEAKWLTMHGARQLIIDRKTGDDPLVFIRRAAVSICGGTQPGTLARLLTQAHKDSGFSARLLLVQPDLQPKQWTDAKTSSTQLNKYVTCMKRLYTLEPKSTSTDGSYVPLNLKLTADALDTWRVFYNQHNAEASSLSGDMAARWAKLEGYAARFALIIRHLDWAFGPRKADPPVIIGPTSIAAGIKLARWFARETKRIHGFTSSSAESDLQAKAIAQIQKMDGAVTASSLARASSRFEPTGKAQEILDALAESGQGKWERSKHKKGGRPTQKFVLND